MRPAFQVIARGARSGRPLVLAVLLAIPLVLFASSFRATLQSLYFPSGWIAAAGLVAFTFSWWQPVENARDLRRRMKRHLTLGALLAVVFAVHVDYRVPNGWIDLALFGGFFLLMLSLAAGVVLVRRRDRVPERAMQRWLSVHTSLAAALIAVTLAHALLVHAHGFLAYMTLGKST